MSWCKVQIKGEREAARVMFSRALAPGEAVHYLSGDTYIVREQVALDMAAAGVAVLVDGSEDLHARFDAAAAPARGEPPPSSLSTFD